MSISISTNRRLFAAPPAALALRVLAGALVLALLAGCGAVKPTAVVLAPVPPSRSVDEADRTLAQVMRERAQAEAAFAASEQVCYAKFFVNNCLDAAREKRRAALSALRAVEIEAAHFKRQAKVDERDRALAAAEKDFQAQQATMAADAQAAPRVAPAPEASKPVPAPRRREAGNAATLQQRQAQERAQEQAQEQEREQAGAAKRAASVAAYEQRQREAEQRQRDIASKKKAAAGKSDAP
ncbi:MAG: hypothetical protein H7335_19645 [Massilia sp.]|nr:hypothetical protein [Massilia sp.]